MVRTAVVIPAGPKDDTLDTLESILQYVESPRAIVVVDDSNGRLGGFRHDDVTIMAPPAKAPGGMGGLWVKIAAGYRQALTLMSPDVVLRIDADAMMLGPGLPEAAASRFAADPSLGMLGSYRTGPDGGIRDWTPAQKALARETGWLGLRRPPVRRTLRTLSTAAAKHGYIAGEHPLGGCYLHSGAAVLRMQELGYLNMPQLASSGLGEDHLFALATVAAGFRIGDFGGPADPLALSWRGLPRSPQELIAAGKLATHSVRSYRDMLEPQIRDYFAHQRRRTHPFGR